MRKYKIVTLEGSFSAESKLTLASNFYFAALLDIYKICVLLHRSTPKYLAKFENLFANIWQNMVSMCLEHFGQSLANDWYIWCQISIHLDNLDYLLFFNLTLSNIFSHFLNNSLRIVLNIYFLRRFCCLMDILILSKSFF